MFQSGSPYSPFFTSGLLFTPECFAIQPDYRSFLSLDLPEPQSLHRRRSRDSSRTIPSPKPAPSITLPSVPTSTQLRRGSTSSAVSPAVRKINRSHALARLEGRTNSTRRRPNPSKRNFMSMSDEESEGDPDPENGPPSVINEPEDLVLPSVPLSLSEPRIAPLAGRFPSSVRSKRQTTAKDWFSLKSFIDLQAADDDATTKLSWRSFIEVARVS